ncbi:MAG: putative bifunctional diguanylate cyclase/phosphodiesterase, partial [Gammaproteobacteria bacterium]
LVVLLILGAEIATVVAVLANGNRDIANRAEASLYAAGALMEDMNERRANAVIKLSRRISANRSFRDALVNQDQPELERMLAQARRLESDMLLALDAEGRVVAGVDTDIVPGQLLADLIRQTTKSNTVRTVLVTDQGAYDMLLGRVGKEETVGWLGLGFALTDKVAKRTADFSGSDISFVRVNGQSVDLIASSLEDQQRGLVAATAKSMLAGQSNKDGLDPIWNKVVAISLPFAPGSDKVLVVMQESMDEAMAAYQQLRSTTMVLAGITLVFAFLGAIFLSRTVTRPIQRLAEAAKKITMGDYDDSIRVDTKDEFGQLAKAFRVMQESIAERENRIRHQANHDSLTGLPNKRQGLALLRTAIESAEQLNQSIVVMLLHLQRFREIESSLGHEIGDEVLCITAKRLRKGLPDEAKIARLEGDQFLVVLPNAGREWGKTSAESLANLLDAGLIVQGVNVTLEARIGLCLFPENGQTAEDLMRRAAVAKNDAQQDEDDVHIYQNGRESRHIRQLSILGDLRRATDEDEFELYVQPKISLVDGHPSGAESLLRWQHPELGFISPAEFVPLAEKAGSVALITEWVLNKSFQQRRVWKEQGLDIQLSVNLSGRDLMDEKLPYRIMQLLRQHKLESRDICLEITEEALVRDVDHAVLVLNSLRDIGVRISMDDFGTGYSSLSQLKSLPMDELKIDRAFVFELPDDPANCSIVHRVIELSHDLGLEVVAEGVETVAALRWLKEHGCEQAQGYHLSKPMPAGEFAGWVANWSAPDTETDQKVSLQPQAVS